MSKLPEQIYAAAQVRELDRLTIGRLGIASYELMTRAGEAALHCLRREWPDARRILVVCGFGNNAGDGYVLARLAQQAGLQVSVAALCEPSKLTGDALTAWRDSGCSAKEWSQALPSDADVIVDAIFGTGLSRPLDARVAECVNAINASGKPILALDIPSGLHADSGQALNVAIRATRTIVFVGLKLGFYVGVGPNHVGVIEFASLGAATDAVTASAKRLDPSWLSGVLPPRLRTAHKGSHGRLLIVGGGRGMPGAVRLAGEAALRVGAGLVTVATRAEHANAIVAGCPELIVRAIDNIADLPVLIANADVVAIGPGLGQEEWSRAVYALTVASDKPLIVDADALNLLSMQPQTRSNWVLTPHPGEAGRLLATDATQIQADRLASARAIAARYRAITVLKGAASWVVREEETPYVCDRGNPGMATAGMGDVLTGAIAGLAAQLQDLWAATRAGVLVHALAGDAVAAEGGERGLLASDLFPHLRRIVNSAGPRL